MMPAADRLIWSGFGRIGRNSDREKVKMMTRKQILTARLLPALASGLLLTLSFPGPGISLLAWVALVPLLFSLHDLSPGWSFVAGLIAGWTHYLTLGYWLIPTIMGYGGVPLIPALSFFLVFGGCLAVYTALFALKPLIGLLAAPFLWVGLEYLRTHLFTGMPWGIVGYSQYERLYLIQIADIFGVYGLSFVVVLVNVAFVCLLLLLLKREWRGTSISIRSAAFMVTAVIVVLGAVFFYGFQRLRVIDEALTIRHRSGILNFDWPAWKNIWRWLRRP